jgi:hypothetical protein
VLALSVVSGAWSGTQGALASVWLGSRAIAGGPLIRDPRVAIDGRGDVATAWDGADDAIEAAARPAGEQWGSPLVVSQGVGEVGAPLVVANAAGSQLAVAWAREGTVEVSEGSLSPFRLHAPTMLSLERQGAGEADLAMNAAGDEVAGWQGYEHGEKAPVLDFRPAASLPWLGPQVAGESAPALYADASPQVAVGSGGDAVAVWSRFTRALPLTNEAAFRPAGGSWEAPVTLPGNGSFQIELGIDGRGDAVAVWQAEQRNGGALEASIRPAASGTWQTPEQIAQWNTPTSSIPGGRVGPNPALAVGDDGEALLAWEVVRGGRRIVEVDTGSAHTGIWQPPVVLASWPDWSSTSEPDLPPVDWPGPTPIARPTVALDNGLALVAWDNASSREVGNVEASVRPGAASTWEPPVAVAHVAAEGVHAAVSASGEAALAWKNSNGEGAIETNILARLGITAASLSHERFRLRHRRTRVRSPFGARVRFDLSAPADVRFSVAAYRSGVLARGTCVAQLPQPVADTVQTCTRRIPVGSWLQTGTAGLNTADLTRSLVGLHLHPGAYRLTLSATDGAGDLAAPVGLPFYLTR